MHGCENEMVRLVGLEPTTGKTPVDFKPTAYANFATAAPATRHPENITVPTARRAPSLCTHWSKAAFGTTVQESFRRDTFPAVRFSATFVIPGIQHYRREVFRGVPR